jgi:hypothetical protein
MKGFPTRHRGQLIACRVLPTAYRRPAISNRGLPPRGRLVYCVHGSMPIIHRGVRLSRSLNQACSCPPIRFIF